MQWKCIEKPARGIQRFYASFNRILCQYLTTGKPCEEEWKEVITEVIRLDVDDNTLDD